MIEEINLFNQHNLLSKLVHVISDITFFGFDIGGDACDIPSGKVGE